MTVALFIGIVTILHIVGYVIFIYWTTRLSPGDTPDGEIIDHTWDGDLKEINNPSPGWLVGLFYLVIAFGIVYLVAYPGAFGDKFNGLLGWTQNGQYEQEKAEDESRSETYFKVYAEKSVEELAKMPAAVASGQRIFLNNCAVCHGQNAKGAALGYPDLTDNDWLWGGDETALITSITHGRNTILGQGMPAGGALVDVNNPQADDEQKLTAVANYVRQLGGHSVDAALAAEGKVLYDQSCIACHGADGKGNTLLGAPNLADNIWLYSVDGNIEDIKQQIVKPVNNMMPAWQQWLNEGRIKVVAAYVYSLSHKE